MPLIRVEMFQGRTDDQKKAMAARVTDAFLETCGGTPESVTVIIEEKEARHWAVGGKLLSEK